MVDDNLCFDFSSSYADMIGREFILRIRSFGDIDFGNELFCRGLEGQSKKRLKCCDSFFSIVFND